MVEIKILTIDNKLITWNVDSDYNYNVTTGYLMIENTELKETLYFPLTSLKEFRIFVKQVLTYEHQSSKIRA